MNPRSAIGGVFACATLTLFPNVGPLPAHAQQAETASSPWGSLAGVSITRKADTATALSFSPTASAPTPDHAPPVEGPPKAASAAHHPSRTKTAKAERQKPKSLASSTPEPATEAAAPQVGSAAPASAEGATVAEVTAAATSTGNEASATGPSNVININTAPVTALNQLGSGRVGKAIVSHRPYRSIDELVDRKVLRSSDFQKLRSKITVERAS